MTVEHLASRFRDVGRKIDEFICARRMTGVAISVTEQGRPLWEQGFGLADIGTARPVTRDTPFSLASVTKPFTAAAILSLAQSGRLDLDDPLDVHISLPFPASRFDRRMLTLRRLGGHVAGLPSLFGMLGSDERDCPLEELVRDYGAMAYPAAERYEYANLGYALLDAVAAKITGTPFDAVLRSSVIEPMRLENTFFRLDAARLDKAALLYDETESQLPFFRTLTPASGELFASAHDLTIFSSTLMRALRTGDGHAGFGSEAVQAMFTPVHQDHTDAFTTFGWSGGVIEGEFIFFKDGGQPGTSAKLTMLPKNEVSIAILANRTDNRMLIEELTSDIAAIFMPNWRNPASEPLEAAADLMLATCYDGNWDGVMSGKDTPTRLQFNIDGESVVCKIGTGAPIRCDQLDIRAGAFSCTVDRDVEPASDSCARSSTLHFKLVLRDGRLVGRCLDLRESQREVSLVPFHIELWCGRHPARIAKGATVITSAAAPPLQPNRGEA